MQQCGDGDSGQDDYDYGDLFAVKNGASTKTDCSNGEVCCVPKPKPELPKCEDFEGYACTSQDVRLSVTIQKVLIYTM